MKKAIVLTGTMLVLWPQVAAASEAPVDAPVEADSSDTILVTASRTEEFAGTKTETPLIETPQPITIITEDVFRAQGAINISDTVRYAAGITANPYGRDTRVDGFVIRGINALQFRDGMRDIFSYYASITADPYNFSRVEVVRGPASVLFGQGSIGGLVNLVSKTPVFETGGEAGITYGSYDRIEAFADVNAALSDKFAVRMVGRVRNADTYVDHVPDDRVFFAPSVRWQPTEDTDITLLGVYQEDDGGSTSQFLPIIGTLRDNPDNPEQLDRFLFVGKPGWDRYDGRLLQGGGSISHRFSDAVQLNLKARYIDSDVTYFTHYTDSYTSPTNPYLDPTGRLIGLYSDGSYANLNVFTTDNNLQLKFNTGDQIEHLLLAGVDYSWNEVRKRGGFDYEVVDLYDIDRDALTIPTLDQYSTRESQKQLGFYLQDQIRLWDRVSVVLGVRRDRVDTAGGEVDKATTFRAGIIGEIGAGVSPFFSYTESFQPIAGATSDGSPFKPQRGVQYEAGVKWQPDLNTLVTVTGFHIKESNRPVADPANPLGQIQSGELTTKGVEFEATRTLPDNFDVSVSYGYNKLVAKDADYFDYLPRHTASIWSTKTFEMGDEASLRLGAGVHYTGKRTSIGPAWTNVTGDNTLVDALAEVLWRDWRFSINATNLFNDKFYASCLARGDCFMGAPRNVMGTVAYRF
ncbi:TonB-dependent siderophore receptor [Sphingomonas cavernae]|uniref:TonB-dependent siderophore receptor n=1 Tax=Sphingomonas cavernae TaxID=2320861 RepID=A0A418WKP4_9SPHN|nr:TonB-dependent siderophore receptor [Sphingomonas cavernae]RJF90611.1 TonB-dependent siderophore receptor [Sphingomonas cavernae]